MTERAELGPLVGRCFGSPLAALYTAWHCSLPAHLSCCIGSVTVTVQSDMSRIFADAAACCPARNSEPDVDRCLGSFLLFLAAAVVTATLAAGCCAAAPGLLQCTALCCLVLLQHGLPGIASTCTAVCCLADLS